MYGIIRHISTSYLDAWRWQFLFSFLRADGYMVHCATAAIALTKRGVHDVVNGFLGEEGLQEGVRGRGGKGRKYSSGRI